MFARRRAVLDTNVVVDGLLNRRRVGALVMRALFEGVFDAFATLEVVAEYRAALRSRSVIEAARRVNLDTNVIDEYAEAVTDAVGIVDPGPRFHCDDPDDEKFTSASSGAHADFLVTTDGALLALGEILEARVVKPEQFAEEIGL